jgi:hypothetical protein
MRNASAAQCVVAYDAPDVETRKEEGNTSLRWKAIPWVRIVVDTLLIAGILLASSSFLSVR